MPLRDIRFPLGDVRETGDPVTTDAPAMPIPPPTPPVQADFLMFSLGDLVITFNETATGIEQ